MAKKSASEAKPAAPRTEDSFVELMLLAADYAKACGGVEQAKRALDEAGKFIDRAGSAAKAAKALEVLDSLRSKIG